MELKERKPPGENCRNECIWKLVNFHQCLIYFYFYKNFVLFIKNIFLYRSFWWFSLTLSFLFSIYIHILFHLLFYFFSLFFIVINFCVFFGISDYECRKLTLFKILHCKRLTYKNKKKINAHKMKFKFNKKIKFQNNNDKNCPWNQLPLHLISHLIGLRAVGAEERAENTKASNNLISAVQSIERSRLNKQALYIATKLPHLISSPSLCNNSSSTVPPFLFARALSALLLWHPQFLLFHLLSALLFLAELRLDGVCVLSFPLLFTSSSFSFPISIPVGFFFAPMPSSSLLRLPPEVDSALQREEEAQGDEEETVQARCHL